MRCFITAWSHFQQHLWTVCLLEQKHSLSVYREHQLPSIPLVLLVQQRCQAVVPHTFLSKAFWVWLSRSQSARRLLLKSHTQPEREDLQMTFPDTSSDRLFTGQNHSDVRIPAPWHNGDDINLHWSDTESRDDISGRRRRQEWKQEKERAFPKQKLYNNAVMFKSAGHISHLRL